jgi:asparagine synthase (glutamine-hydrolysing)
MCGIAGFVHLDGRPLDPARDGPILERMGAAIRHRGPDDARSVIWQNVGFMFRRLAIVDLQDGMQPFHTPDGRITAMTNGEIYNHQEIRHGMAGRHSLGTRSDCEVVPYLYLDRGLDLFEPVQGKFAVALLDRQERRLLLARDRLGIKPLFYCMPEGAEVLVFASELKALFAHPAVPRRFDWLAALERPIQTDSRYGELPSGFVGIDRLPAAHIMDLSLDGGRYRLHRYWRMPERPEADEGKPAGHYVEAYRALLEDSVRKRLMADVDVGLFLSGGIDSSAIAAIAARQRTLPTFSVRHLSTQEDASAASAVARHLDVPNHQVSFDALVRPFRPDDWRHILWSCELCDIVPDSFFKFFLHAYARQRYPDLKVILLGQGSDEFNGGYLGQMLGRSPPIATDDWARLGNHIRTIEARYQARRLGITARWPQLLDSGILRRDYLAALGGGQASRSVWDLYSGLWRSNLDHHIWHEDRTASANAIENRLPFLDHRLVELQATVPERLHAELFTDKMILRRAVHDLLPPHLAMRRKVPFYGDRRQTKDQALGILTGLIKANKGELLDQAIAGSERTGGPLDADKLRAFAGSTERAFWQKPRVSRQAALLRLVNMGLLADMAASLDVPAALPGPLPVRV